MKKLWKAGLDHKQIEIKKFEKASNRNFGLKKPHLINLRKRKPQSKVNGQNTIQIIRKMGEKFIIDVKKPNVVDPNVVLVFVSYIMQTAIKLLFPKVMLVMIILTSIIEVLMKTSR